MISFPLSHRLYLLAEKKAVRELSRWQRLIWPSAAELKLMRIMGCQIIYLPFLRPRNGIPAVWVRMTDVMKREHVKRIVRVNGYDVDFGNDVQRAIEIVDNGRRDVLKEQTRDEHMASMGWRVLKIPVHRLRDDIKVRQTIRSFLEH